LKILASSIKGKMSIPKIIKDIRNYIKEVIAEMKKVTWTSRRELFIATLMVIILSAILSIFIGFWDLIFSRILHLLLR